MSVQFTHEATAVLMAELQRDLMHRATVRLEKSAALRPLSEQWLARCARLLTCPVGSRQASVDCRWFGQGDGNASSPVGCPVSAGGGALSPAGRPFGPSAERLTGAVPALCSDSCRRTPRLTSARGPGWLQVGDMMLDGAFRQMLVRPLSLSGPSPRVRWVGSSLAGSRPRFIG